jgi:hypothetical protein
MNMCMILSYFKNVLERLGISNIVIIDHCKGQMPDVEIFYC